MGLWDALTDRDEESLPRRQRNASVTTDADRKAREVERVLNDPSYAALRRQPFVSPYVPCLRYEAIVEWRGRAWAAYAVAPDADTARGLVLDMWSQAVGLASDPDIAPDCEMDAGTAMAGTHKPYASCERFGS